MEAPSASHRGGSRPASLPEAARILGVSESTVRRLVKAGKLQAERALRPQGYVWTVLVPAPSEDPPDTRRQVAAAAGANPPAADALAAWTRGVLEPLITELSLGRQTIERQAEQIADLREERGRLVVELEHARAAIARPEAPESHESAAGANPGAHAPDRPSEAPSPLPPWARPWWAFLAVLVLAVAVLLAIGGAPAQ